jgi:NAD-dependent SIR2 family protein deacetylase
MTAPTKASLQRELRAMTKRAEEAEQKLAPFLQWSCKQCGCSFGHRRKKKDDEGVKYCSGCYSINVIAAQRDVARASLARIRCALRPVLAYFGEQWIGDRVRKEYQELVQFAKGSGDE